MKQISLSVSVLLFGINTAISQTTNEKYFEKDSISFVSEHCSKSTLKKKESILCYTEKYMVRIKDKTFIEYKYWTDNTPASSTTFGDLRQVDFITSKITTQKTTIGKDLVPVESYLLWLYGQYGTYPFTISNKYFKPSTDHSLALPFATYEDAAAAKKYLENLVEAIGKK